MVATLSSIAISLATLYEATDTITGSSNTAVYVSGATGIIIALIGGVVAVKVSGRSGSDRVLPTDEPTTHAVPREMADLLVDVIAERDRYKHELELCRRRHAKGTA